MDIKDKINALWEDLQHKSPFTGQDAALSTALQAYLQGVTIETLWNKQEEVNDIPRTI